MTITVEYIDGKIVQFEAYKEFNFSQNGHAVILKSKADTTHIIPLINVRDICVEKQ